MIFEQMENEWAIYQRMDAISPDDAAPETKARLRQLKKYPDWCHVQAYTVWRIRGTNIEVIELTTEDEFFVI